MLRIFADVVSFDDEESINVNDNSVIIVESCLIAIIIIVDAIALFWYMRKQSKKKMQSGEASGRNNSNSTEANSDHNSQTVDSIGVVGADNNTSQKDVSAVNENINKKTEDIADDDNR